MYRLSNTSINQQTKLKENVINQQQSSKSNHTSNHYLIPISDHELRYRRTRKTFVQKLYSVLSFEAYSNIISWNPSGLCFKVHNKDKFIDTILPELCESIKWKSFLRQLSSWGFKRGKISSTNRLVSSSI